MSDELEQLLNNTISILKQKDSLSTCIDIYGEAEIIDNYINNNHFNLKNESGTGEIIIYNVFSGIDVIFNNMHMGYCNKNQPIYEKTIEINHCKQGRYECSFDNQKYCYMSEGDLSIVASTKKKKEQCFPLKHYYGITIIIKLDCIKEEIKKIFQILSIKLDNIYYKLCEIDMCCIMRANEKIEHIFSEIYHVKEDIKIGYLRIKILEILLVLSELDFMIERDKKRVYFTKKQIDTIKNIHNFLIENISEHYTLKQLSERFDITLTIMKKCFKEVYGEPIYSYLKRYRLQIAKIFLEKESITITEIARRIGYENPNKFTNAFKNEFGISPTTYRKKL